MQDVLEEVAFELTGQDISSLGPEAQEEKINDYLRDDRERGFDLRQAPLTRLALFKLSTARFQMVWTWHHLILDAPSLSPILKDLFSIYKSRIEGTQPELNEVVPYRKFIDWLDSSDLEGSEEYWKKLLKGFSGKIGRASCRERV